MAIEINYRFCKWCGQAFEPEADGQRYCSPDCADKGKYNARRDVDYIRSQTAFAKEQMAKIKTGVLDKTLEKARKEGKTYAEIQKERTLELSKKGLI